MPGAKKAEAKGQYPDLPLGILLGVLIDEFSVGLAQVISGGGELQVGFAGIGEMGRSAEKGGIGISLIDFKKSGLRGCPESSAGKDVLLMCFLIDGGG